jgi:oxygen-independent coproporphyrinogen-3 oxidase
LIQEIHLVGSQNAERKNVTSLYFGGGTPALAAHRIKEIVDALNDHLSSQRGLDWNFIPIM